MGLIKKLILMFLTINIIATAQAKTVLEDTVNVVIDPLKLGEASNNALKSAEVISASLDRTLLQLNNLQDKTDADIRDYLMQITEIASNFNSTIQGSIDKSERLLLDLARKTTELEKKVHRDAIDLIWRTQCAVEVIATDTLQRALAEAINSIKASDPKFIVFGLPAGKLSLKPIDIKDPDIAYRAVKKHRLRQLNNLMADDDAYIIRSTYLNLARLSKLTQCHYIGQDTEVMFIKDYYEFERLSVPWNRVVRIED